MDLKQSQFLSGVHVKLFSCHWTNLQGLLVFGRRLTFFEWLKQCETDAIDKCLLGVRATEKVSDSFGPLDGVRLKKVVGVTSPVAQLFALILTRSICCRSWQHSEGFL